MNERPLASKRYDCTEWPILGHRVGRVTTLELAVIVTHPSGLQTKLTFPMGTKKSCCDRRHWTTAREDNRSEAHRRSCCPG